MFKEMQQLDGRVAVVTGGNGAIGRACALALAEWGARVVVCAIDEKLTAEAVRYLADHGYEAQSRRVAAST